VCVIYRGPGVARHDYWIVDQGSRAGTVLYGRSLVASASNTKDAIVEASQALTDGDVISLGLNGVNSFLFLVLSWKGWGNVTTSELLDAIAEGFRFDAQLRQQIHAGAIPLEECRWSGIVAKTLGKLELKREDFFVSFEVPVDTAPKQRHDLMISFTDRRPPWIVELKAEDYGTPADNGAAGRLLRDQRRADRFLLYYTCAKAAVEMETPKWHDFHCARNGIVWGDREHRNADDDRVVTLVGPITQVAVACA
jgi:hypothetical protein